MKNSQFPTPHVIVENLLDTFFENLRQRNIEQALKCFDRNAVFSEHPHQPPHEGQGALRTFLRKAAVLFSDSNYRIETAAQTKDCLLATIVLINNGVEKYYRVACTATSGEWQLSHCLHVPDLAPVPYDKIAS